LTLSRAIKVPAQPMFNHCNILIKVNSKNTSVSGVFFLKD
jgi:hypothetical protein